MCDKHLKQLVNFHCHSDQSLDGAATPKQIVKHTKELGCPYVSVTEHGNMNSAMDFYSTAKDEGLKPVLGIELYLQPFYEDLLKHRFALEIGAKFPTASQEDIENKVSKKMNGQYTHLTVHFKDEWAYKYFMSMTPVMESRAVVRFGERKPIMLIDELFEAAGHIVIGSGCIDSSVHKWVRPWLNPVTGEYSNRLDIAEEVYARLREMAGKSSFYAELFPHSVTHNWQYPKKVDGRIVEPGQFYKIDPTPMTPDGDLQKYSNEVIMKFAEKYGDRVLVSIDSHFAVPEQKVVQDAKLGNGMESFRFYNSYYIPSSDEVAERLEKMHGLSRDQVSEMIDNSYEVAKQFDDFHIQTSKDRWILPELPENWLEELKQKIDRHGRMDWDSEQMMERLKYELGILAYNGKINLISYFFVVEDIANFCRENKVLMNTRGSAGGSLLLYLLGVSAVNPLKHDLPFERFLTEGRIHANTLPDVDMDFGSNGREKVFEYLKQKYGAGFCRLSTDALLKLKSSIKDAERSAFGFVRPETEAFVTKLPNTPQGINDRDWTFGYDSPEGEHIFGLIETNPTLAKYANDNPEIWESVCQMLGVLRQKSGHACGTIIASIPVTDYSPMTVVGGELLAGYAPKAVEKAGGVKYDLLGLNTLQDIQGCLESIFERTGETINPWELPDDDTVWDNFQKGKTETVFQFDTETVRPYLVNIKPKNKDELANITALCRPSCLDAPSGDGRTLAQVYVARCNGEHVSYIHPDLEPILGSTMGIALLQEQVMRMYRDLAGFTNAEAEEVRRGIGKKDEAVLRHSTEKLREGCLSRGWTEEQVVLLIQQIMASARYGFNHSHAESYAYVAYACMYLKTKYPLDWWKSVLSNADKGEVSSKFWKYVKDFMVFPDINKSGVDYQIVGDKLVAPIGLINGIGEKAYEQLIASAPYQSIEQFAQKHFAKGTTASRSAVTVGVVRKLVVAGVLDSLFAPDAVLEDKLFMVEKLKAEVKHERIKPIPPEYVGITPLGRYLAKKELIKVYSEDLRPIMLPSRGGTQIDPHIWKTQDGYYVLDGEDLQFYKEQSSKGIGINGYLSCIAYVIKEETKQYKNKTKQMTKVYVDAGGTFWEEVIWPHRDESVAPTGFKDLPVLMVFESSLDNFRLRQVIPMLSAEKKESYSIT